MVDVMGHSSVTYRYGRCSVGRCSVEAISVLRHIQSKVIIVNVREWGGVSNFHKKHYVALEWSLNGHHVNTTKSMILS